MSTAVATADTPTSDWLAEAQRVASLYQPPALGRPSDALVDIYRLNKLFSLVARGNYLDTAARAAGFSLQTISNWKRQAEAGNVAAIAFVDAYEKAQAEAECDDVEHMNSAKKRPELWAASATKLQRRHPDRWGIRQDDGNTPKVVVQIGAGTRDVTINLPASGSYQADITNAYSGAIDVTPVDASVSSEVGKLTEDALSDADTRRSRVVATQTALGATRRGNREGTLPGNAGGYEAPRGVSSQRRIGGRKKKASR